jgi:hypothetical protein
MADSPPRSERTARDNARARALGYRDYYDYRVHGFGRIPAGTEVTGEMRRAYRGHAGLSDLIAAINRPRNRPIEVQPQGIERGADGRWKTIRVGATFRTATGGVYQLSYYLRGQAASSKNLRALRDNLASPGSRTPPSSSGMIGAPTPGEDAGGDDGEEPEDASYYDYWGYEDEYGDYDPIPFIAATSIGEFSA